MADDWRDERGERSGKVDRLVVEVEPGEVRPRAEHLADRLPMLVGDLIVLRAVANKRAELGEEAVKTSEAFEGDREARDDVAAVVRLKHSFVLYHQLLHRLHDHQPQLFCTNYTNFTIGKKFRKFMELYKVMELYVF